VQEEIPNYLSVLSIENITELFSYEEALKEHAIEICRKNIIYVCVSGGYLIKMCYFFGFCYAWVFVAFFKFVICYDFFSHSK
jgi:hypothetical protein